MVPGILPEALQSESGSAVVLTASEKCVIMTEHICRHGEIGRHKGLKIPRRKKRTGSSPVAGTRKETAFVYQTKTVSFQRNKSLAGFVKCPPGVKYG